MRIHYLSAIVVSLALGAFAYAQDATPSPLTEQSAPAPGGGHGQRGEHGQHGAGRGVMGTVTEAAADHYTIKTFGGQTLTVHIGGDTRILKQGEHKRGEEGAKPETIKASDIKVGDAIEVRGRVDTESNSVDAKAIVQIDPQRAQQMQAMAQNFGKTLLLGKVTAIEGTKITIAGRDNAAHTFVVDENTSFHRRRLSITLADVKVGDAVRADGEVKDGVFAATNVNVIDAPPAAGQRPVDNPPSPQ